jgi:hypothetical protein
LVEEVGQRAFPFVYLTSVLLRTFGLCLSASLHTPFFDEHAPFFLICAISGNFFVDAW